MGSGVSSLFPCIKSPPAGRKFAGRGADSPDLVFEPLDETLGHSFCYVRSSNRFLSPTASDRFVVVSPSTSLRFSPSRDPPESGPAPATAPAGFKAISGASVSANTFTPRTVDGVYDGAGGGGGVVSLGGFESTALFSALPLQPGPRGGEGYFLSGPLERGALSGPLDPNTGGSDNGSSRVPFSAPLGGAYVRKRGRKGISGIKKAIYRNISEKKKQLWVVPVWRETVSGGREEEEKAVGAGEEEVDGRVQWALGKAGEDRVHVVVSEEQGWLFVGIYDGFNGPDAPEFLMGNLYKAVYRELQGLFWEVEGEGGLVGEKESNLECDGQGASLMEQEIVKKVRFQSDGSEIVPRKRLWEFLAEERPEDGLDLSGSERFAFSVDDAISIGNAGSAVSRRWLLLSKLKQGLSRHRDRKLFPWKHGLEGKEEVEEVEEKEEKTEAVSCQVEERGLKRRRKVGPVDHQLVLSAMSRALEVTELAYLDMTDKVLDTNPELALMGSCLLVVLMRDEDVYVMNVGDSRAIVAQNRPRDCGASSVCDGGLSTEGISEGPALPTPLAALQLSTDHSTSIEEVSSLSHCGILQEPDKSANRIFQLISKQEVIRIKSEHPDDSQCIVNDRVKGRLKVTRAFGAGSLKKPKYNDALLEMFRNQYIGTAPYISCQPSLHHHRLCPMDQFLVLSSDGLYQYLTNEEVVSDVESFMEKFPDGDPAQHLIEEVLSRAAKKAGMDFHELLDIPQGDRRKYHDDVTVMVVSLEGRIWKSSGKYL